MGETCLAEPEVYYLVDIHSIGSLGMLTAAGNSHPGDTLFPLKMKLEDVRVRSADASTDQARLYLQFAGRRLSEMPYLLDQGRYADTVLATSEFARNIEQTSAIARDLSQFDPVQAAVLNSESLFLLRAYNDMLSSNWQSFRQISSQLWSCGKALCHHRSSRMTMTVVGKTMRLSIFPAHYLL